MTDEQKPEIGGGARRHILLIDVDSKIPNLALMKVSAYYRSMGDEVGFDVSDPDMIYASVIFKKNAHKLDGLKFLYPDVKTIDIGGSGVSLEKELPSCIDSMIPDYTIYPDATFRVGFTTRGCIRNCPFCIVRRKEGRFHRLYDTVDEAITSLGVIEGCSNIQFLDNNILADKEWFMALTDDERIRNSKIDFNQGLDIRLMDSEIAARLKELHPLTSWKFAFDMMSYKDDVLAGIKMLKEAGINVRHNCLFYVYCNGDEQFDDAVARLRILKENGVTGYTMMNMDIKLNKRLRALKRWTRPWIFWTIDINDFLRG